MRADEHDDVCADHMQNVRVQTKKGSDESVAKRRV